MWCVWLLCMFICFFNDTDTTEIYTYLHTLALHDARPISIEHIRHVHMAAWEGEEDAVLAKVFQDQAGHADKEQQDGQVEEATVILLGRVLGKGQIGRAHV